MTLFEEIRFFMASLEKVVAAGKPVSDFKSRLNELYLQGECTKPAHEIMKQIADASAPGAKKSVTTFSDRCSGSSKVLSSNGRC